MRAQGQAMRAASDAAALGTVLGKFPSHNVAALNPMAMGETRDTLETPETRTVSLGLCGTFRNSTQGRVNAALRSQSLHEALHSSVQHPQVGPEDALEVLQPSRLGVFAERFALL